MAPGMERSQDTNGEPEVVAVSSFAAIDALIEAHNDGETAPAERPDQATVG